MDDIFKDDIFKKIYPSNKVSFDLLGVTLPTNHDVYFVAKWNEVFDRYATARLFVRKALEDNWDYWFDEVGDKTIQRALEIKIKGELYETALLSYNILVDLTWVWTYVSVESFWYDFDKGKNVKNAKSVREMYSIEEALDWLRKNENRVFAPNKYRNPYSYLKNMMPEFSDAIDTMATFWNSFSNSNIRALYNYIKHKGKPSYKEVEELRGGKAMSIISRENIECISTIRDVQKIISVEEG